MAVKLKGSVTNLLSTPVHFQGSPFTRMLNMKKEKAKKKKSLTDFKFGTLICGFQLQMMASTAVKGLI